MSLAVFAAPGRYVQGRDATAQLGEQLKAAGFKSPILILAGKTAAAQLAGAWAANLPASGFAYHVAHLTNGECTAAEVERLAAEGRQLGAQAFMGAGGGKVLDAARAAAALLGVPVACCPTAASSDAPCSAVSVIYTQEGAFEELRTFKHHPALVLVDTSLVARAPRRLLVAGLGDALATYFEARASSEAARRTLLGGTATLAGVALARLCYETLLADAPAALAAVDAKVVTPALERVVEANTLLSGLGFECGGLAVAHSVYKGLSAVPGMQEYLHGEQVAFGTVVQLVLEGRPHGELDAVLGFCCRVGLPVTLEQVGVDSADKALLDTISERATAPGLSCHNEPFPVTAQSMRDALLAADQIGRQYLAVSSGTAR